ncbi:MAG: PorP/SprF family type IX secretion system membrane protein [Saprospiraceae bacterium]
MKKYIIIVISIAFLLGISKVNAQVRLIGEQSVYTMYYLNPVLVNPGATGYEGYHSVVLNYRKAWASFPNSPSTGTLSYNGPIGNRIALGILAYTDSYGAFNTNKGQISFSYNLDMPNNKLGIGISAEYIQHKLNGDAVANPLVDITDEEIFSRLNGSRYFDASIGIFGIYDDKVTYGVALPSVISQRLDDDSNTLVGRDFGLIANLGYKFDLVDKDLVIEPSIYAKQIMLVPFHVDINLRLGLLDEKLTMGVSYSTGAENRLGFIVGAYLDNFGVFYGYNTSFNQFQSFNNGSHELSLKLKLQPLKTSQSQTQVIQSK